LWSGYVPALLPRRARTPCVSPRAVMTRRTVKDCDVLPCKAFFLHIQAANETACSIDGENGLRAEVAGQLYRVSLKALRREPLEPMLNLDSKQRS
jgi:hypothetical protein